MAATTSAPAFDTKTCCGWGRATPLSGKCETGSQASLDDDDDDGEFLIIVLIPHVLELLHQLRQWLEEGRKPPEMRAMRSDWSLESIKTKLKHLRRVLQTWPVR